MALEAGFAVLDWVAQASAGAAAGWQRLGRGDASRPAAAPLPMLLRRRLTPLGAQAVGAALEIGADAGMHYVFASRHGEIRRTVRVMQALTAEEGPSPADFSLSVHNALAGLLSIASGAKAGHTAIAAGADSFAAGLVEALAQLAATPETPVLLAYYDEALPPPLAEVAPEADGSDALALALLLGAPGGPGEPMRLAMHPEPAAAPLPTLAQARGVVDFLAGTAPAASIPGGRLRLEWRRGAG